MPNPTSGKMKINIVQPSLVLELFVLRQTLAKTKMSSRRIITAKAVQKIEISMVYPFCNGSLTEEGYRLWQVPPGFQSVDCRSLAGRVRMGTSKKEIYPLDFVQADS